MAALDLKRKLAILSDAAKYDASCASSCASSGADAAPDGEILKTSEALYGAYKLRRVYSSGFSPILDSSARLPLARPPLLHELSLL